jgi:A/G-specific adenine glycosylase
MKLRQEKDIWHGLYDFHLIEKTRPVSIDKLGIEIKEFFKNRLIHKGIEIGGSYKHILSHQVIHSKFIMVQIGNAIRDQNLKFYTFEKIADLPKPALITRFLTDYKNFYS